MKYFAAADTNLFTYQKHSTFKFTDWQKKNKVLTKQDLFFGFGYYKLYYVYSINRIGVKFILNHTKFRITLI